MSECIKNYGKAWKNEFKKFSPTAWSFVSFILPLALIPAGVKAVTTVAKEVKKAVDKNKKK